MKPKITSEYIEFSVDGMNVKGLNYAEKWMEAYCKREKLNKNDFSIEGNNDVPWLRYYFPVKDE